MSVLGLSLRDDYGDRPLNSSLRPTRKAASVTAWDFGVTT